MSPLTITLFTLLLLLHLRVIQVSDIDLFFAIYGVLVSAALIILVVVWLWSVCWPLVVAIGVAGTITAAYFYHRA